MIGLSAKIGSCRAGMGEVAGEDWLHEGAENYLGTTVTVTLAGCLITAKTSTYPNWGRASHRVKINLKV
jgi:hypothetical protein